MVVTDTQFKFWPKGIEQTFKWADSKKSAVDLHLIFYTSTPLALCATDTNMAHKSHLRWKKLAICQVYVFLNFYSLVITYTSTNWAPTATVHVIESLTGWLWRFDKHKGAKERKIFGTTAKQTTLFHKKRNSFWNFVPWSKVAKC